MPSYIVAGKWPGKGEHELGVFTINGFTRETSVNEEGKNKDVYLKNVGDKATLWFTLKQDIASLNGNSKLQINEDKDGWDQIPGLVKSARLNVVAATQKAKTKNPSIPDNLYLIEDLGTDRIMTWQEASGILYQSVGTNEVERIKKNFCDYIGS